MPFFLFLFFVVFMCPEQARQDTSEEKKEKFFFCRSIVEKSMGMWKIFVQRVFFIGYVLLLQHGMMKKKRKNSFLGKNKAGECLLPLKWGNDYKFWCIAILVVCVSRSIFGGEWIECTILQFSPPKRNKKIYSRLVCRTIDSNYDIIIVFLSSGPLFYMVWL